MVAELTREELEAKYGANEEQLAHTSRAAIRGTLIFLDTLAIFEDCDDETLDYIISAADGDPGAMLLTAAMAHAVLGPGALLRRKAAQAQEDTSDQSGQAPDATEDGEGSLPSEDAAPAA